MPNRLAREKSPYLLQHADNPVDWLPWGGEAFAKARAEQKPIFLSIGYSTCHWCHVMAHESFEDSEVAELLNRNFVPVKVDREERPDVDRVYMTYLQALTGHGGWPLNVWLAPDLKPFYGGTYFPPEDWQGRHGFKSVLRALAQAWATDQSKLLAESNRVVDSLKRHFDEQEKRTKGGAAGLPELGPRAFGTVFQYFHEHFDDAWGGFGGAPKFPRASNIDLLFRFVARAGRDTPRGREALAMAEKTLRQMAMGGIRDHVGGGFHRYSVDEEWFVPHFEKMLYDQAQIASNYVEAYRQTRNETYAWIARDTLEYMVRELQTIDGGFRSAEDADSLVAHGQGGHAEGAFYIWTKAELDLVLGDDARLLCEHFGVEKDGNVGAERDPHGEFSGKNILRQRRPLAETAKKLGLSSGKAEAGLAVAIDRLRKVRSCRPRPHLDDKIISAWNGLAIGALAKAARVLSAPLLCHAAVRAAEFVQHELYDDETGVLFRSCRNGRGNVEGFAEDYAFMIEGLIDLYEATFETRWLEWALRMQQMQDQLFWDEKAGGYFNSPAGRGDLVLRLKEEYDGAEPAASSVTAMNLVRLAPVSQAEAEFLERSRLTVEAFRDRWVPVPQAMPRMLCAVETILEPPGQLVLAGSPESGEFRALCEVASGAAGSVRLLFGAKTQDDWRWLAERAPWIAGMKAIDGLATAYLCEHYSCKAPVRTAAELKSLLG